MTAVLAVVAAVLLLSVAPTTTAEAGVDSLRVETRAPHPRWRRIQQSPSTPTTAPEGDVIHHHHSGQDYRRSLLCVTTTYQRCSRARGNLETASVLGRDG